MYAELNWDAMNRILAYLLFASSVAFAADPQWNWIKFSSNFDHAWDVSRGFADVTVIKGRLTAKLYWEGSISDVKITLNGTVSKSRIAVKETIHNSDFSGSTYTGGLAVQKFKEAFAGATGVETITLSDGFGMIGLTRTKKE
jgi:hypothetical protein